MNSLENQLSKLTASLADRQKGASIIKNHPNHFDQLFNLALDSRAQRIHIVSSWILEQLLVENIILLRSRFDYFLEQLPKINHSSMQRPLSKILYYYVLDETAFKKLNTIQIDSILDIAFDWVIAPAKTATFSFAIKTISLLKNTRPWIKATLKEAIENDEFVKKPGMIVSIKRVFIE